jgi:putative hemolysin
MSSITFEMLFVLLLIIANGVLAMSEIAIVSARKARLQQRAHEGDTRARAAVELASAPTQFLSTVQVGITLLGILAGAFSGVTLAQALAAQLRYVPWLAPYHDAIALAIVVVGLAYLTLVFGELVPKRLALHSPERIAAAVAAPMRLLSRMATPAVHLLSISTEAVLRVSGIRPSAAPLVTEEEIMVLIEQGVHRAGHPGGDVREGGAQHDREPLSLGRSTRRCPDDAPNRGDLARRR